MQDSTQITVPTTQEPERVDKFLTLYFQDWSRSKVQKLFTEKRVFLNNQSLSKNHIIKPEQTLSINLPEPESIELKGVSLPLDIVYEDEDIIVLNKTSGITTHPGNATKEDTLVHALLYHCQNKLSQLGGNQRPGVVHRLDKETSGLIIFAKTDRAYLSLIEQFEKRTVQKEYLALIRGIPNLTAGSIKANIQRHTKIRTKMQVGPHGRFAHTDWKVEKVFLNRYSLLRCFLHTGRTHQIRVHLTHIGHPILGDFTYGYKLYPQDTIQPKRVMLHAAYLSFIHPNSQKQIEFKAKLPDDFETHLKQLQS